MRERPRQDLGCRKRSELAQRGKRAEFAASRTRVLAGRKREINIASERERERERAHAGRETGQSPGVELELDGSPARKIHIFKYFSHGPQSPRHADLPPTACYPLRTRYLLATRLAIAVVRLSLSPLFYRLFLAPSSFVLSIRPVIVSELGLDDLRFSIMTGEESGRRILRAAIVRVTYGLSF